MSATRQVQNIRVMSLGEIVKPHLENGVSALAILTKHPGPVLLGIIRKLQKEIDSFKLGTLNETDFNNLFISAISAGTGVTISVEQFDKAWSRMNPDYQTFKENLQSVIQYNATNNQKYILVSFTNPKDMRQLQSELEKNNVPHKTATDENGLPYLTSIEGIELLLTYREKKTRDEIVKKIQERFTNNATSTFVYDVKYIQGEDKLAPNIMEITKTFCEPKCLLVHPVFHLKS